MEKLRLGVNIPMFLAGCITLGAGTLAGMIAIWGSMVFGQPAPYWAKIGHAHASWWGALMIIASLLLPNLEVKPWFKKFAIAVSIAVPWPWVYGLVYGGHGLGIDVAKYLQGLFDVLLLIALGGIALVASGIRVPVIYSGAASPGRFDYLSNIEVERRTFLVPTLVALVGVSVGYAIALLFHLLTHEPIKPAALVQLHNHPVLIAASAVIALLVLKFMNVTDSIYRKALRITEVSLVLTTAGLFAFVFGNLPSVVWVAPAGLYFIVPILAFLAVLGVLPRKGEPLFPTGAFRASLAVVYTMILVLVAVGAVIALLWSTTPDVTVTYKQPEGVPYPGPYPAVYMGTPPARGTPRGLENAHLSPGSWSHVAAAWLLALAILTPLIVEKWKKPGLLYLFLVTIPLAPLFNTIGRFLAWATLPPMAPGGIGALFYAGHPIKGMNVIALSLMALIIIILIWQNRLQLKELKPSL
ncbi:MAG: hypothetical protein QXD96_08420 [Pyrobaculum sp.]